MKGGERLTGEGLRLEADIKNVVKSIVQGNEKRLRRIARGTASGFDIKAAESVKRAVEESCGNISSVSARKQMQEKVYMSVLHKLPYEHIVDVYCGRRQFYNYRTEFIIRVALAMEMIPERKSGSECQREI